MRKLLVWLGWLCPHCYRRDFTGWVFGSFDLTATFLPAGYLRFCRRCGEEQWKYFGLLRPSPLMPYEEYRTSWTPYDRDTLRARYEEKAG